MVRSYWNGTLVAALALPGLVWGQTPQGAAPMPAGEVPAAAAPAGAAPASPAPASPAPANGEHLLSVQEAGKPAQKCRVLKCWCLPDGTPARDVQDVATGEVMTILDNLPASMGGAPPAAMVTAPVKPSGGMTTRIFHWGGNRERPSGVPMPPGASSGEVIVSPTPKTESGGFLGRWFHRDKVVQAPATPSGPVVLPPAPSATAQGGRKPAADACVVKGGAAPADAGGCKPGLPGECCAEKAADPLGEASASAAKPFQRSVVKGLDTAQPTDWRRSWGKPDTPAAPQTAVVDQRPKTLPPAGAVTKVNDAAKAAPPPRWPEEAGRSAPPVKTVAAPRPDTSKPQVVQVELPKADTKKPDPLTRPEAYSRRPLETKPEPAKVVEAKKAPEKPAAAEPAKQPEAPASGVASTQQRLPMGASSVLAAYAENPGQVIYLPVPVVTLPGSTAPRQVAPPPAPAQPQQPEQQVNAFSPVPQPGNPNSEALASNAFATSLTPAPPAQPSVMYPPAIGPVNPMQAYAAYAQPQPGQMYSGPVPPNPVARAGYNPGMMPGSPRPMMPGTPNGVMPAGYVPAMPPGYGPPVAPAGYYPPMPSATYPQPAPPAAPGQASTASAQGTQQLMLTLKDALYPSHREWAAEALATADWRTQPQVVDALLMSAKEDPAPTVRAGSVRALAKMNVNTAAVVSTLQALKGDADPRVRQDVEQALTSLGTSPGTTGQAVQPAGAVMPK